MSEEDVRLYHFYKDQGKTYAAEGNIEAALKSTERAYAIHASDRIKRRIEKLKAFLKETQDENDNENMVEDVEEEEVSRSGGSHVDLGNGLKLSKKLHDQLYAYQKEGIQWLWGLHRMNKGGVLGDDMGLGKTIQIITFLTGLFEQKMIRSALIIMPVSLITNWCKEFLKWAPNTIVATFHSETKSQRERNLIKIQRGTGVLITSYGMIVSNVDLFKTSRGQNFVWDYIVLDEGHKIKNPTKTTKAIHEIPAKHRLVLTGTPIQNNLKELWALYDFSHQGTLLGSLPTFKMQYETIITRSREKNATSGEKKLGNMMADSLRQLIAPYFLRRTKQEVLRQQSRKSLGKENQNPSSAGANSKQMSKLPQKNDIIVWLHLSEIQIQIYDDFVKTDQVKNLLMTKKSPLVALTVLKKICDHPRLLSARACLQLGMNGEISQDELEQILADEETTSPSIDVEHEVLLRESGKLSVLLELLERLKEEGHRTLVFSQSRKMLDIINNILSSRGFKVLRLDGTIKKLTEREQVVNMFQKGNMYSVMLLTTQVGGVGLTLTAADRVIIYDPSWNPATDAQAVDRAYRIGQTKPVVIYRLITCGTVEEKIYRRQIFKDSITRKTTGASEDPHRYFTNMELKELFRLDDPRFSSTQRQLEEMHAHQRLVYPELEVHLNYLQTLDIFGISDHDLMFQGQLKDTDDYEEVGVHQDQEFIQSRVEKAKLLLQLESEHAHNENVRSGTFCKDLTNFQKSRTIVKVPGTAPINDNDEISPPHHPPGPSVMKEDSFIVHDVTSGSVEELTEEEIEDMKNVSQSDPAFAKALEISLREYKSRASMSQTPNKKEDKVVPEIEDLNLALTLSLNEYKEFQRKLEARSEDNDAEDEDMKRAMKLSLEESMAPRKRLREEEDFVKAIELSQAEASFHNQSLSQEEDDLAVAVQRSLSEVEGSPFEDKKSLPDLKNLSMIDQDFAEAVELSLRENSPAQKEECEMDTSDCYINEISSRKNSMTHRKSEILVVESDFEDSEPEGQVNLPTAYQAQQLVLSTPKSFLASTPFSKSRLSEEHRRRSQISNIAETDPEDCNESSANSSASQNHTSFLDSSYVQQVTRKTSGQQRFSEEHGRRSQISNVAETDEENCNESSANSSASLDHTSFLDSSVSSHVKRKASGRQRLESSTEEDSNLSSTSLASDSSIF